MENINRDLMKSNGLFCFILTESKQSNTDIMQCLSDVKYSVKRDVLSWPVRLLRTV